jgi:N6-adenosine-specific RNA methylase IME4
MTRPALTVIKPDTDAAEIGTLYRTGKQSLVDSLIRFSEAGQRLIVKKEELGHGNWLPWLTANAVVLGFNSGRTARRLMELAGNGTLASDLTEATALEMNRQLWGHTAIAAPNFSSDPTPNSYPDEQPDLDRLLRDENGKPTPQARAFIAEVRAEKVAQMRESRDSREVALAGKQRALPTRRYGVIYADAPWYYETRSDAGRTRAADTHYPCMTLDEIRALDVPSIAADDAVLFHWATVPMLAQAIEVTTAWGFAYKSNFVWVKPWHGHGHWSWNQHEHLLIGSRGKIPAPAKGTQWRSVIEAPLGRHSEKPAIVYELIEHHFPNLPKIELFARGGRKGWDAWGNEAP